MFCIKHSLISLLPGSELLRERGRQQAAQKKNFLPENRTSMINEEETEKSILSAFCIVIAYLNFQINRYFYNKFIDKLATFPQTVSDDDWKELILVDTTLDDSIKELTKKVNEIKGSLVDVQRMSCLLRWRWGAGGEKEHNKIFRIIS